MPVREGDRPLEKSGKVLPSTDSPAPPQPRPSASDPGHEQDAGEGASTVLPPNGDLEHGRGKPRTDRAGAQGTEATVQRPPTRDAYPNSRSRKTVSLPLYTAPFRLLGQRPDKQTDSTRYVRHPLRTPRSWDFSGAAGAWSIRREPGPHCRAGNAAQVWSPAGWAVALLLPVGTLAGTSRS